MFVEALILNLGDNILRTGVFFFKLCIIYQKLTYLSIYVMH